ELVRDLRLVVEVRPDVKAEAGQVHRPDDVRHVGEDERTRGRPVRRADDRRLEPLRRRVGNALLEERAPLCPVRAALHERRPPARSAHERLGSPRRRQSSRSRYPTALSGSCGRSRSGPWSREQSRSPRGGLLHVLPSPARRHPRRLVRLLRIDRRPRSVPQAGRSIALVKLEQRLERPRLLVHAPPPGTRPPPPRRPPRPPPPLTGGP